MTHQNHTDQSVSIPDEIARKIPTLRVIAMPADANPFGDIFGGWILSQMDLAGAAHAYKHLFTRVVTVGIEAMSFHKPVAIGDEVSFYTKITKIGTTSITINIESWAFRRSGNRYEKVTGGLYTYVQVDEQGAPLEIEDGKKKWQD